MRGKAVTFFHRMIQALGPAMLPATTVCLPTLLTPCTAKDTEIVVQLLNKLMIEFGPAVSALIDRLYGCVTDKYMSLFAALDSDLLGSAHAQLTPADSAGGGRVGVSSSSGSINSCGDGSSSSRARRAGSAAPKFEAERLSLQKQYVDFLQHIALHGCHGALSASACGNDCRVQAMLTAVLSAVNGGSAGTGATGSGGGLEEQSGLPAGHVAPVSLPLRKSAVCTLIGLVQVWSPNAPHSPTSGVEPTRPAVASTPVPSILTQMFSSLLYDEALPILFAMLCGRDVSGSNVHSFSSGSGRHGVRAGLDMKDADANSFITDIGCLLWAIVTVRGSAEISSFLQHMIMPRLGWSQDAVAFLCQLLAQPGPQGTFKESFKSFVKNLYSSMNS